MDSRPREVDALREAADGAAAPAIAMVEVEVTKPRNDKRGYRRVVLPNALECLLISDPDTDKVNSVDLALRSGRGRGFCIICWVSSRF
jgi:insulysin